MQSIVWAISFFVLVENWKTITASWQYALAIAVVSLCNLRNYSTDKAHQQTMRRDGPILTLRYRFFVL